mgnify:CR=1 FL=1
MSAYLTNSVWVTEAPSVSNVTVNTSVDTVRRSRGSACSGLAGAADCGGTAGLLAAEAGPGTVLTGTLAAYAHHTYLTVAISSVVFTLIAISYFFTARGRGKTADFGLTTEFAAVIVFCTGYLLVGNARLGVLVGIATLALLVSREWLHRYALAPDPTKQALCADP